jgi:hypothetical protein
VRPRLRVTRYDFGNCLGGTDTLIEIIDLDKKAGGKK